MCHSEFVFSLLTEGNLFIIFIFLVKVKFVWISSHLPPPHLASCLPRIQLIRIVLLVFGNKNVSYM